MKKWQKILGLMTIIGLTFTLAACGTSSKKSSDDSDNPSSVEAIKKRGKIRIAVFGDLSPYGYLDAEGKNQGYDVYLAKRIAKDLLGSEDKVEFVVVNAEERVDALKSNKVDLVLANFTKTAEREKVIDFANPYMKVAVGVVSLKSNPITKVDQLKGKSVIVNKGTTAEQYFTKEQPDVTLEKYESKTQQFQALTDGRADALADDNSYLYAWVKENPDYEVGIKELGEVATINPGVKKGNKSLLDWTNKELEKLGEEKFFEADYNATLKDFFGSDIQAQDIVLEGKE
ncbi:MULTISPECIES: cysteine ABC transporter substrate-binding protein [unclassified Enterococcus]|uniref:cysteine ABC transporter substrate-binding protein n=1 Tax=unclassified Enterococcus TaxID=2608891 RepID=UPI001551FB20|nr:MULTISPECIES: cysteine ABC transporter substrate-binding protein [unclassified Enterococcus]MBS7577940.1 cysteine ABC transporter substrate-binding protein [Enterococcus sp. MMGLQ5-2]MBS7585199.1 cysteine ABC transporter substrate-binding protein [Enterococcus sp. MMGLQ5-1]NPD13056.1 cysteine ABC transporter substrate-binding protein [Enterococcus sp. MMGLQ5-1]NPD37770.1 cysteine ABC transporter substrate-binding protein [Enterococcus sp. MMGLQ5-2]